MPWDSSDTYREGLDFFSAVVDGVPGDAWQRPSPCEGWRALDVLGHLGAATSMGARILRGGDMDFTRDDPPGSVVEGDPVVWWHSLATEAHAALEGVEDLDREVDSPMGRRSIREGLSFPAVDLFIHGWDLATATGQNVTIPAEAIAFTEALFATIPDDTARRPGVFADRHRADANASPTAALIAFTGRDPNWTPPC